MHIHQNPTVGQTWHVGPQLQNSGVFTGEELRGILADGEWESLVASLSLKRKQNNNGEGSWALGRKPSHSPFVQEAASMPGEPSYTRAPLIIGMPCQSAIFSEARTLPSHFTNTNIVQVMTGENTQTDCNKIKKNFWKKQYIGRIHYRSSNKGPYVSLLFMVDYTECL